MAGTFGIHLYPVKNDFSGIRSLDLLGVFVDTRAGLYLLSPDNMEKIRQSATVVFRECAANLRFVRLTHILSFAEIAQSTFPAVTDFRLHLRSNFEGITEGVQRNGRRSKLSHQDIIDPEWGMTLKTAKSIGRAIWSPDQLKIRALHSDANLSSCGAALYGSVTERGDVLRRGEIFSNQSKGAHVRDLRRRCLHPVLSTRGTHQSMGRFVCGPGERHKLDVKVSSGSITSPSLKETLRGFRSIYADSKAPLNFNFSLGSLGQGKASRRPEATGNMSADSSQALQSSQSASFFNAANNLVSALHLVDI